MDEDGPQGIQRQHVVLQGGFEEQRLSVISQEGVGQSLLGQLARNAGNEELEDDVQMSGADVDDSDDADGHAELSAYDDLPAEADGPMYDYDGIQQEGTSEEHLEMFDPLALGLKEINNLAHFSVSSHKPGNGVEELLSDDLTKYWQSDGPQPHLLTIHFLRRVEIRAIRFYVDFTQDESYTPTLVMLSAGTGHHDLLQFATVALSNPVGWQNVNLSNVGGGNDGQSLCCWIVQIQVKENHQNGKDTHIRGIKLYAIDENAPSSDGATSGLTHPEEWTKLISQPGLCLEAARRPHFPQTPHGDPGSSNGTLSVDHEYLLGHLMAHSEEPTFVVPDSVGGMTSFMRDMEIR